MDDASLRVSDADRDQAVIALREHLLAGRLTIFGHRRDWGRDVDRPDAPTIHMRALGFAGTIDIWRVPHDVRDSNYSDIFRALEGRQRQLPAADSRR